MPYWTRPKKARNDAVLESSVVIASTGEQLFGAIHRSIVELGDVGRLFNMPFDTSPS